MKFILFKIDDKSKMDEYITMLTNINEDIDKIDGHTIEDYFLEKFGNIYMDQRHAEIILRRGLLRLSILVVENDNINDEDIFKAIEIYPELEQNSKQEQILGLYFESIEITKERKEKILKMIDNVKDDRSKDFLHIWICEHYPPC